MAEGAHVDGAGQALEGRGEREVGTLDGFFVPGEGAGGGELRAAAAMFPCAGERGQHADGADSGAAVFAALDAVVHAQGGGPCGGVLARELFDFGGRHAGPCGDTLGRVVADALGELVEAVGHGVDVGAVFEAFAQDDVHHAEGEGDVGAGANGDVPVGKRGGAGLVGVDDDEARAVAAGLFDEGPEMNVVAVDVGAPGEDELGEAEVFGGHAELFAVDVVPRNAAGFRADGAIELAGAEAMEEAAIHGAVAEHADGARVAVGQDRFGAMGVGDVLETCGDCVEGFVPGDALEGLVLLASGRVGLWGRRACAGGDRGRDRGRRRGRDTWRLCRRGSPG